MDKIIVANWRLKIIINHPIYLVDFKDISTNVIMLFTDPHVQYASILSSSSDIEAILFWDVYVTSVTAIQLFGDGCKTIQKENHKKVCMHLITLSPLCLHTSLTIHINSCHLRWLISVTSIGYILNKATKILLLAPGFDNNVHIAATEILWG